MVVQAVLLEPLEAQVLDLAAAEEEVEPKLVQLQQDLAALVRQVLYLSDTAQQLTHQINSFSYLINNPTRPI
jgi:septal ring factor EnvC (AmiA/AmiB activator)